MCNLWNFGHLPSFMPKYGNFKYWSVSRKPLPVEQKYAQFQRPGIERECMSLLLELWPMANLVVKQSAKAHGPLVIACICLLQLQWSFSLNYRLYNIQKDIPVCSMWYHVQISKWENYASFLLACNWNKYLTDSVHVLPSPGFFYHLTGTSFTQWHPNIT